ncbi:general secretion pathway protein GspB [Zobellella maritima]|uniref:general secretion pathway protein GspB n=1 Tax=Zobellella maritima TaxID=2059725 RepID=UPI000E30569C|nr:general secretion pathway protein GspB [Zobellella maritima]
MSYILDALRQSERQRRQARPLNIHNVRMMPEAATTEPAVRRWRGPLALIIFILSALGIGYALGMVGGDWLQQDRISSRLKGQLEQPPLLPSTSIIVAPEAPTVSSSPELARLQIRLDKPPVSQITIEPSARPKPGLAQQTPIPPITSPAPVPERPQDPGVIDLRQLPSALQSRLPTLSLSVHIYSDNAEHRMVKINDRMLREGQNISPTLRLKSITPLGVILNFEGHEFHMRSVGS